MNASEANSYKANPTLYNRLYKKLETCQKENDILQKRQTSLSKSLHDVTQQLEQEEEKVEAHKKAGNLIMEAHRKLQTENKEKEQGDN